MSAFKDLSGQIFGEWEVLSFHGLGNRNHALWDCKCRLCGRTKTVVASSLLSGHSTKCRSCATRMGRPKPFSNDPIKTVFTAMKQRCYNPNTRSYQNYGACGVTICDEWMNNPQTFYEWAYANGYRNGLSIERIDIKKGYSPDNCTFIPISEQSKNRSISHIVTINGVSKCASDWAKLYNIHYPTLAARVKKGMTWEEALKTPLRRHSS